MKKILFVFLLFTLNTNAFCANKKNIIQNLINTQNLSFNFEKCADKYIVASDREVKLNPRSRSAKLRSVGVYLTRTAPSTTA